MTTENEPTFEQLQKLAPVLRDIEGDRKLAQRFTEVERQLEQVHFFLCEMDEEKEIEACKLILATVRKRADMYSANARAKREALES